MQVVAWPEQVVAWHSALVPVGLLLLAPDLSEQVVLLPASAVTLSWFLCEQVLATPDLSETYVLVPAGAEQVLATPDLSETYVLVPPWFLVVVMPAGAEQVVLVPA